MEKLNESVNKIPEEEELDWLWKFARIVLADVPGGYTKFKNVSIDGYSRKISVRDYIRRMEEMLLNYPQLRLAINTINPHGKAFKLSVSKDLLEEWSDWKRRWTADDDGENPTVYESHLFRCFVTIKAELNSMATEDYAMVLEAKLDENLKETMEVAIARNAPPVQRPPSPIHPKIDDNAIKSYFKSVKKILNKNNQPDKGIYRRFKKIFVAYGKNLDYPISESNLMMKLTKVGVCQEMCELLEDHKDILSDFIEFLPHIGHISRNFAKYDAAD